MNPDCSVGVEGGRKPFYDVLTADGGCGAGQGGLNDSYPFRECRKGLEAIL